MCMLNGVPIARQVFLFLLDHCMCPSVTVSEGMPPQHTCESRRSTSDAGSCLLPCLWYVLLFADVYTS